MEEEEEEEEETDVSKAKGGAPKITFVNSVEENQNNLYLPSLSRWRWEALVLHAAPSPHNDSRAWALCRARG
jgi:hypothetical protein